MKTFKDLKVGDIVYSVLFDYRSFNIRGDITESHIGERNNGEMYLSHMDSDVEIDDYYFNFNRITDESLMTYDLFHDRYVMVYATNKHSLYNYIKKNINREIRESKKRIDKLNATIEAIKNKLNCV